MKKTSTSPCMYARAAAEYMEAYLTSMPKSREDAPSPELDLAMKKLIVRLERKARLRRIARSAAVVLLALAIGAVAIVSLSAQANARVQNWIRTITDGVVHYHYSPTGDDTGSLPGMRVTWLPNDYELVFCNTGQASVFVVFEDMDDSGALTLSLSGMGGAVAFQIPDTSVCEDIRVNNMYGELYTGTPGDSTLILHLMDSESLLCIDSTINTKTLLRFARGIKIDY